MSTQEPHAACRHERGFEFSRTLCACGAMHNCCPDCGETDDCPLDNEPVAAEPLDVEALLRKEWWLNHGHDYFALYGDDGEMSCGACPANFKREPLEALYLRVLAGRAARAVEATRGTRSASVAEPTKDAVAASMPAGTNSGQDSALQLIEPEPEKLTERDMLDRLRSKYAVRAGNGPRYAFVPHVRDRAGFDAIRTLDAIVMDTWPSSGLALHGFEIKVSRSDWKRELAQPEKADAFIRFLDYFWVAAPRDVVRKDELPDGWGLIETRGAGLVVTSQARRLTASATDPSPWRRSVPEPLDRSFVASLMRAACRV